jgi:hypothetical protein
VPEDAQSGTAFIRTTIVVVAWKWLALLAVQIALASAFFVAIVVYTARLGIDTVKTSATAGLFAVDVRSRNNLARTVREVPERKSWVSSLASVQACPTQMTFSWGS